MVEGKGSVVPGHRPMGQEQAGEQQAAAPLELCIRPRAQHQTRYREESADELRREWQVGAEQAATKEADENADKRALTQHGSAALCPVQGVIPLMATAMPEARKPVYTALRL